MQGGVRMRVHNMHQHTPLPLWTRLLMLSACKWTSAARSMGVRTLF